MKPFMSDMTFTLVKSTHLLFLLLGHSFTQTVGVNEDDEGALVQGRQTCLRSSCISA